MRAVPLTLAQANGLVAELHRHHKPCVGHRFSIGAEHDGRLVGAAIVGRPVARKTDQYNIAEVTRLVTDGTKNVCSFLYGAAARIAKEMGFASIQTFILDSETGTSLRAAGWEYQGLSAGGNWNCPSRGDRREDQPMGAKAKYSRALRPLPICRPMENKPLVSTGPTAIPIVASSLRHSLIASPGNRLLIGDFAGIEARLVLALAGQHDKTELMASGQDVYRDMARLIYRLEPDDPFMTLDGKKLSPAQVEMRTIGKNTVLGCGFQMGWQTFADRYLTTWAPGPERDEFAAGVIRTYRKEWAPKVPVLWYGLQDAAARAVHDKTPQEYAGIVYAMKDEWLTCRLLDGKLIYYYGVEGFTRPHRFRDGEFENVWSYWALKTGKWVKVSAYGGLLTENVIQALARQLLVNAMKNCRAAGYDVVLTVHDEIVCDVPEAVADHQVLKLLMEDVPRWCRDIKAPIESECFKPTVRYRK